MNFKEFIAQNGTSVTIDQHSYVFRQGFVDETLYFVVSGLLKAYYVSMDGKESIKSFIKPGSTIGSLSSAYQQLPCSFSLVALEETQLIKIRFDALMKATASSHVIAQEMIESLLTLSMKKEQREYEFLTLSAEERYRNLCESDPELVERLTQNDIARYLGITPVALSRIRKRMRDVSLIA